MIIAKVSFILIDKVQGTYGGYIMESKKKWSAKGRILIIIVIIVGILYWIMGKLQVRIASFFKETKKEISNGHDRNNKKNKVK